MTKGILFGVYKGEPVSIPVIVEDGQTFVDESEGMSDLQRGWRCALGFHVWDGNRCINCDKTR